MLNEDTKIELELSGEIDNKQQENLSEESNKTVFDKMSLPVPINLSQPAVKEWFGRRKASIRPAGVFFNTANFQVFNMFSILTLLLTKRRELEEIILLHSSCIDT